MSVSPAEQAENGSADASPQGAASKRYVFKQ